MAQLINRLESLKTDLFDRETTLLSELNNRRSFDNIREIQKLRDYQGVIKEVISIFRQKAKD